MQHGVHKDYSVKTLPSLSERASFEVSFVGFQSNQWGGNKMVAVLETTLSNNFFLIKLLGWEYNFIGIYSLWCS